MSEEAELGVDIGALSARVRFNPEEGAVWLEGERMMLIHLSALATLRNELIATLGMETARGMLMRMGYASGALDGALARRVRPGEDVLTNFLAGPRLHAIEGVAVVEPVAHEFDAATNYHSGEWIWRNSAEVEAHLQHHGLNSEPVCWSAIGYASAYTSVFMGRPILYREVECRGMGHAHCRIVGKPIELWAESERDDLRQGIPLSAPVDGDADHWGKFTGSTAAEAAWADARMVGASPSFVSTMNLVSNVAATDAPVLLVGEVGVGKKSVGRSIQRLSKRSRQAFVTFNCASLSGSALDIELFGVEKSANGSAGAARNGRIERAHNGTLFLEDIHCLDLRTQTKLLRVLQAGEVERVGGTQPRPVNVRILASSTARILQMVRDGEFRDDLYYRLNTFPIALAPLRERRSDIPLLIRHFASSAAKRHGREIKGLSQAAISFLTTYELPGNVAELESMIERAVILAPPSGLLDVAHLMSSLEERHPRFFGVDRDGSLKAGASTGIGAGLAQDATMLDQLLDGAFQLESFESEIIARAVERASGNLSKAARTLGMTRPQLAYRVRRSREGAVEGGD